MAEALPTRSHAVVPNPDPSVLTTDALLREVGLLKEFLLTKIECQHEQLDSVIVRMERLPGQVDEKVSWMRVVHEEKFRSVDTRFNERDTRTEQTSRDSKVAVDAALQAAKEAVSEQNRASSLSILKSETATMKQMDQISTFISTSNKALDDKIDDLKERLTRNEGHGKGVADGWGYVVGLAGILLAAASVIMAFVHH